MDDEKLGSPEQPHPKPGSRARPKLARLIKKWSPTVARKCVSVFVAVIPILYISHLLERFSGSALWLPHAWRESVLLLSTLFGTIVFHLYEPELIGVGQKLKKHHAGRKEADDDKRRLVRAARLMACCMVMVGVFMLLRYVCVYSWDARHWAKSEEQYPDIIYADATQPATSESNATPTRPLQEVLLNLPNFVDIEKEGDSISQAEILLPLWYPASEREYIESTGQKYHENGIMHILNVEPNRVINWGRYAWGLPLGITVAVFLAVDVLIIFFLAAAAGSAYGHVEAAMQLMGI